MCDMYDDDTRVLLRMPYHRTQQPRPNRQTAVVADTSNTSIDLTLIIARPP